MTVPPGQWVHIQMEATLGQHAPKMFALTVSGPDGKPQTFDQLPFAGDDFRELHWPGFSSTAPADTEFYVDNLKVQCAPTK